MLVAAGLGSPLEHALISRLAPDRLRVSGATGADIEQLAGAGYRTLTITRKGGNVVTIALAPRTARTIDLASGKRCHGPILQAADGRRLDRHGAGRIVRWVARQAGISKAVTPHTKTRVHFRGTGCRRAAARCTRGRLPCGSADHHEVQPGRRPAWTGVRRPCPECPWWSRTLSDPVPQAAVADRQPRRVGAHSRQAAAGQLRERIYFI